MIVWPASVDRNPSDIYQTHTCDCNYLYIIANNMRIHVSGLYCYNTLLLLSLLRALLVYVTDAHMTDS